MIQAPPSHPNGLPLWVQIVSLSITAFLAVLRTIEFFNFPELYVRLTRDLFFRMIDEGEALFCHAVLISRNGPVLIQDITLTLKRIGSRDTAEKSFPIQIRRFGEKVKGPALIAEHHFYSSSPLQYLPENSPLRAVYLGVQREYHSSQQRAIQNFTAKVLEFKSKYINVSTEPGASEMAEQVLTEFNSLIKNSCNEMLALVQLEVGKYEASILVKFETPGFRLWKRKGTSKSTISFLVEEQPISNWKAQLDSTLRVQAKNLLTGSNDLVIYPEFQPVEFEETEKEV